jgi:hypothetical protein
MMLASRRFRSRFGVSGLVQSFFEVRRHCDQPLADSFIEDELIVLSSPLARFASTGRSTSWRRQGLACS